MKKIFFLITVFMILISKNVFAFAGSNFSADMVATDNQGQKTQAKVYFSDKKMRMEMAGTIIINRFDQDVCWVVMADQGMYMEQPIQRQAALQAPTDPSKETERVSEGKETIDGRQTEKFRVTYVVNNEPESVYQWINSETPIPLKMQAIDGSWTVEYRNVQLGAQPDSLFEVPAGIQKLQMPMSQEF